MYGMVYLRTLGAKMATFKEEMIGKYPNPINPVEMGFMYSYSERSIRGLCYKFPPDLNGAS